MRRERAGSARRLRCRDARPRARRGIALFAALVLLALSAALVAATFSAARARRHAAMVTRVRARVEAGVPRAFAEVLAGWNPALDSLVVGGVVEIGLASDPAGDGPRVMRAARVERTTDRLYSVTVDLQAIDREYRLARRRARLWLERGAAGQPSPVAGGAPAPPPLVTPWALSDLY